MTYLRISVLLSAAALLAGCVDRGGWKAAPELKPGELAATQTLQGVALRDTAWPEVQWWRRYGDPQLDELVDQALAGSPSLTIAEARLRSAQAQLVGATGARVPALALDAQVTRQRYPEHGLYPPPYAGSNVTDARAALDLSWDIDFWGKQRSLIAAARSTVQGAQADRDAARLALAVAVVRAYVQLDLQYALLEVTEENLKQQASILELTQQRVAAGLENAARVKQSEGTVALTRAGLAFVQGSLDLARNQLADLVGAGPDRGQSLQRPQLRAPADLSLPSALPADLLGRRPDLLAARAEVEAAGRNISAAESDFYPNVNLAAFVGYQSLGLSQLFQASDRVVGGGPALHLPVFNRSALRAALYSRQGDLDASVGRYNQALLDAVREVADVVANWRALERESTEQQSALEAAQRSYELTTERYRAGLDNYLSVLSAQGQVLQAQVLRAELQSRRLGFSVDLVRALGGGYGSAAPAS
ncbi:MAG: efflux transporter outer membrane subunit [Gammaproteobacteria bacterium]|nr:efflux transporter outer membrane subunit [Gammaproteobacteria bacterium]MBV9697412.1 efflux transporter outer membrane subunit [Gammaproteobacteria bacterium]